MPLCKLHCLYRRSADATDKEKALEIGCNDYVSKPVDEVSYKCKNSQLSNQLLILFPAIFLNEIQQLR